MIGFIYGQTEYSMLENTIHLDDYINHAVENGFSFLTITDNNLHGHFKFYQLCKKNNIKPIIGIKLKINSFVGRNNYVLAYAKNHKGYINLLHLATMMEKEGVVSDEIIQANSKGIVFVSSAIDADLDYYIFEQKYALFNDELQRLQNLGDVFYLGVMPSSFIYDTIYQDLNLMIEKHNLLTLPVAKCSYLLKEDEIVYQTIIKLNEQKIIAGLDDLHLKTKNELEVEFKDHYAIFDNLEMFVNQIEEDIIYTKHDLPKYPNKYGLPSENYLQGLCEKGLERRLANKNLKITTEYLKRLKYELDVINKMGYADYFLIVWDFVRFAKQNDVLVGPGRGSAAGSLVAYCLGITEIDPIEYDLLFERFLNPERISMPDIDMDFPDDKRDFVINYVKEKYGIDHVCYISAFGTFQIKSAIRDLFRIFGYDQKYIEPIIRFLEANPTQEEIDEEFKTHPELIELIMIARKMENLPRHISTHAAGIILSSESLFNVIPLRSGLNNMYQAQLEAVDLEKMGLLKIDFLGIRNLSIVDAVVKEIQKTQAFNLKDIPLDDEKTFKVFQDGDTLGIFQLESAGITKVIKKMKPTHFEDIVAVLALYRPGPMENIEPYINRKHGEEFDYIDKALEPILKDTYGIIIYQEQIMKIAQVYAGYSLGEADILRRAVSKKQKDVLENERIRFVSHAASNGYDEKTSNAIYDYIVKFANYGFNRSHTVAYSLFAYQMAYLKANYRDIFIAKLLNNVIGNDSELRNYINYAKRYNIKVYNPDINISYHKFKIDKNGLVMPINAVHNLGTIATKEILNERKNGLFKDFFDFKKRMGSVVNSRMLESLINACAFDSFGKSHAYMLQNIDNAFESYITTDESISDIAELPTIELQNKEREALGFNLKYNVFAEYEKYKLQYKATDVKDLIVNKTVNIIGVISKVKRLKTKKNEPMAFVTFDINNEKIDAVLFVDAYKEYEAVLSATKLVLVNAVVRERNDSLQLQINKMKSLE